jgi:tetratricopeptide (TPR) repeat protein
VLGGERLPPTGPLTPEQLSDQMQSARILMGEGIFEDAKRILRRILLTDPSLVEARKHLEEIHETELKQIFGESETPRHRLRRAAEPITPIEISADIVMQGLDRDLKLGIFDERGDAGDEGRAAQLSLFKDKAAMERFGARMDEDFGGAPAAERIDLGIAFLEMGLYDLAVRHFQAATSRLVLEELKEGTPREPALAATGLLAYALILGGRAFEATIRLQPLLNDVELDKSRKLDLIYLMGRAFEAMGKLEEARQWFGQAAEIDPAYRDVLERLRRAGGAVPS